MTVQLLLASFSALVIVNSLFFGGVLLLRSGDLIKNRILAFLLFGIALRTGKSILMLLLPNVPDSIPAIGLVGMGAVGPLAWFYSRAIVDAEFHWRDQYFLHFILSVVMGISLIYANDDVVFWLYFTTALQMAIYLVLTFRRIKTPKTYDDGQQRWLRILLAGLTVIWAVYSSQLYLHGLEVYLASTVVASITLFVLLFHAFNEHKIFSRSRKSIRSTRNDELSRRMVTVMEKDKLFKDCELTIGKLALALKTKPYVVSAILSEYHGKTFPEFISQYRIAEAQMLLHSRKHQAYSIEAIAFDCGFNTPSAFYTYFKKITKLTPAEYRSRKLEVV